MAKNVGRSISAGEKIAGFNNPIIRNRPWSLESSKCSGCERRLVEDTYQFQAGNDEALAKIWYIGKVNPSKEDVETCEVCALDVWKDDKKFNNNSRKKANENTAQKLRETKESGEKKAEVYDLKEAGEDTAQRLGEIKKIEIERSSVSSNNTCIADQDSKDSTFPVESKQTATYELRKISRLHNIEEPGRLSFGKCLDDLSDCELSDKEENAGDRWIHEGEDEEQSTCFKKIYCNKDTKRYEKVGPRRYNPVWTGEDPSQIGVFIRNLRIEGVDEEKQCVDLHFYLNLVWLDEVLCEYVKQRDKIHDAKWFKTMTIDDYTEVWEQVRKEGHWLKKWGEVHPHTNKVPEVHIWNTPTGAIDERQNLISLNKEWIGEGTVYWRRLIRAKIYHCFKCRTYPFGYETVRLKLRLTQYTKQHLVLLRTNLWYREHKNQTDEVIAGNSFSYLHPDNSLLPDWTLCSVHNGKDRWYSKLDHNDLSYRLPVYVNAGRDTQSWFEAMIILERRPSFVVFNIWIWFSLSCAVSLLTYRLNPKEDLADRLAIAVGIIFVQMQLKIHAASNTPRMPFITALDFHMWTSLLLVVVQAILQVISAAAMKGDGFDTHLFICNIVGVVFVNVFTIFFAMHRMSNAKKRIEKRVELLCNFRNGELNIDSPGPVVVKGYTKNKPLRYIREYEQVI